MDYQFIMKKVILAVFVIFLLFTPNHSYAQNSVTVSKTLVYGGDEAFPPYEFLNKNGKPEGFNVDLIHAIAKKMGFKVKIELGPWYKIEHELETDSIQIVSLYFSDERSHVVDFASPTEVSYYELYLRKGKQQFSSLKDMNGKIVAVEKGSVIDEYLTKYFPGIKLLRVHSEVASLKALSQGKCYAAFTSSILNYKLFTKFRFNNLVRYHKPFLPRLYSFGVKKGNKELLRVLNIGLLRIQEDGEFHKLRQKWIIQSNKSPWITRNAAWILGIIGLLIVWFVIWIIVLRYSVNNKTKELAFANDRLKLIAGFKPTRIDRISAQEQVTKLLEHIKRTFEADVCIVRILKEDQLELFESVGIEDKSLRQFFPAGEGFGKEIIEAKKALAIKDTSKEKSHTKLKKKYPDLFTFASYAGAPLIFEGEVIGIIAVYFTNEKRKFSALELEHFQIVADQLAVSFENARLFEQNEKQKEILVKQIVSRKAAEAELQKSFQTANMLYETSRELSLSMDIKILANSILKSLEKLLKWKRSSIWIKDDKSGELSLIAYAHMGLKGAKLENELKKFKKIIRAPGEGIIGWVVLNGKNIRSGDITKDSRYIETILDVKSQLCIPIIIDESPIGCINMESHKKDAFSEEDEKLLTTLSNLASSAIQNARLFEKLNIELKERTKAEKEVEKLNKDLEIRVHQRTEELQVINKELESFVYSISHDLRAPLRSIAGFSEIISRRYKDSLNEEGREYFGYILESSNNMANMINDLLQFSRLARNPLSKTPVDLEEVLSKVEHNLNQDIKERKATIIHNGKMPFINGDRSLIGQIFSNLIQNALEYHRKGVAPKIVISAKEDGKNMIIKVQDNGQGIPEEHFGKIFDIFQRLHSNDEFPGTGIGLAIVKKAVTALGGDIFLESKVNSGTTFFVKFLKA